MRLGVVVGLMIATMTGTQPGSAGVTPTSRVAAAGSRCPGALRADQHTVGGQRTVWTMALEDKNKKDQMARPGRYGRRAYGV